MLQFGTDLAAGLARKMSDFATRLPLDFQLEFTFLTFALPRHTQANAAISPIAGGMVRGHRPIHTPMGLRAARLGAKPPPSPCSPDWVLAVPS